MYIKSWNDVKDGARVIEDTYNEIYQISTRDGKRYLTIVGSQIPSARVDKLIGQERVIDFEPTCIYDQPWIEIS